MSGCPRLTLFCLRGHGSRIARVRRVGGVCGFLGLCAANGTTKLQMGQNLVTCGYDILVIYIFGMIFVWKFAGGFV